mgnify:FL=1
MTTTITRATRAAGYQTALPFIISTKEKVYEALRAVAPAGLTAEEVAERVGCPLNSARSRLNEIFTAMRVVVIGKRLSARSGVKIAVWALPP